MNASLRTPAFILFSSRALWKHSDQGEPCVQWRWPGKPALSFLEALLLGFLLPFQVALKANFDQMSPEYCWAPAPSSGLRSDLPVVTPNYSLWIKNGECHWPSQSDLGGLLSPRFPGPSPSLPASVNGLPIHLEVLLPLTCPPSPISKSYLLQSAYGTSLWFRPQHLSCLDFGPSSPQLVSFVKSSAHVNPSTKNFLQFPLPASSPSMHLASLQMLVPLLVIPCIIPGSFPWSPPPFLLSDSPPSLSCVPRA